MRPTSEQTERQAWMRAILDAGGGFYATYWGGEGEANVVVAFDASKVDACGWVFDQEGAAMAGVLQPQLEWPTWVGERKEG